MKHFILFFVVLILLGGGSYLGYQYYQKQDEAQKSVQPVKIALKWIHQAQFAGHYVALEEGFYRDEGLDVTLIPFDMKTSSIELVASGAAQFGVAGADELLSARARGVEVVAVAVIYQESPVVAYSLKSSGIKSVADFKGKKIGYEPSENVAMTIDGMITKGGLDPHKDVIRVPIGFDASQLLSGEVDVATGYATNEPLLAVEQGHEVEYIRPSQYGIQDYSDVLFTSAQMITDQPELVRGFVKATIRGWDTALTNQDAAANTTMHYLTETNSTQKRHQQMMLQASQSLIQPSGNEALGTMVYVRWHRLYEEMKSSGIITSPLDISKVYTNTFVTQ